MAEIATILPCSRCGYELRGLDEKGLCPECGQAIAFSMTPTLRGAPSAYLMRLQIGAALVVLGAATPVAGFASIAFAESWSLGRWVQFVVAGILVGGPLAFCAGWWLMASEPPRGLAAGTQMLRTPVKWAAGMGMFSVSGILLVALTVQAEAVAMTLGCCGIVGLVVLWPAGFALLSALCGQIPDPRLRSKAEKAAWIPLLAVMTLPFLPFVAAAEQWMGGDGFVMIFLIVAGGGLVLAEGYFAIGALMGFSRAVGGMRRNGK